jgi:general secretion pathway protein D
MGGGAPKQGAPGAQPQTILEAPVKVSAEESTNAILITSSPRDFASLFEVIKELDMPRRQVYIEAVVMDLSIEKSKTMGFAFHGGDQTGDGTTILGGNNAASSAIFDAKSLQALALAVRGPSITIPGLPKELGTSLPSFGVFIHAYGLDKDTDILSTPHIIATDNIPAEIKVVLNVATQRNVAPVQVIPGLNQPVSGAAQYQKLGPKIKITPHLNESDEVRLDVVEEISDLTAEPKDGLGTITFLERVATTTLTVKDQQTVVIGGLVRNKVARSESKVPFLGDIPVIGALFRTSSTQNEKSNLVLVLTPHIIRDQDDLRRIHERKMQERQEFIDHQALFGDQDYEIPKDMSRTFGLLEDIRQSYVRVAEQRALDALNAPKLLKEQGPTAPLDLPVAPRPKTSPAAPPVNVAPPSRNLDRVER